MADEGQLGRNCRQVLFPCPLPGGPGRGLRASTGDPPIFFRGIERKNGRGRSKERCRRQNAPSGAYLPKRGGRANRPALNRRSHRPCAGPVPRRAATPHPMVRRVDGGARPHLPLLLFPRVTRWPGDRSALAGRKLQALSIAGAAPGEAEGAGIEIRRFRSPPRPPPQSLCGYRALQAPGQRRDDGAIDTRRTDPHDPPRSRKGGTPVRLRRFLFHRSGGDFSLARQRKSGGRNPPGISASLAPRRADLTLPPLTGKRRQRHDLRELRQAVMTDIILLPWWASGWWWSTAAGRRSPTC